MPRRHGLDIQRVIPRSFVETCPATAAVAINRHRVTGGIESKAAENSDIAIGNL